MQKMSPINPNGKSSAPTEPKKDISVPVNDDKKPKRKKTYHGSALALMSCVFYALSSVLAKTLSSRYHPFVIGAWWFSGLLLTFVILIYCWRVKGLNVFEGVTPLASKASVQTCAKLLIRFFFGCSSLCFQYLAMQYINLADVVVIGFSSPVFITIVAHKYLGEKCGIIPILSCLITIGGMIVVTRPPLITGKEAFDKDTLIGIALALSCMICLSCSFLLIRHLRQIHFAFMTSFYALWGVGECLILAVAFGARLDGFLPQGLRDWGLGLGVALLAFISQMGLVLSLKYEEASVVSIIMTLDVIFTTLWQIAWVVGYIWVVAVFGI